MRGIKKNINTKGSHLYSLFPNKNTKREGKGKKSDLRMNIGLKRIELDTLCHRQVHQEVLDSWRMIRKKKS